MTRCSDCPRSSTSRSCSTCCLPGTGVWTRALTPTCRRLEVPQHPATVTSRERRRLSDWPGARASDDGESLHYEGTELVKALTEVDGKAAYRVERTTDGPSNET